MQKQVWLNCSLFECKSVGKKAPRKFKKDQKKQLNLIDYWINWFAKKECSFGVEKVGLKKR